MFQDRYYSELIEDDKQLLQASRYIHLNPVKAKMVKKPDEYVWSSYKMLIGKESNKLISSEIIHDYFKCEDKFKLYQEFVEDDLEYEEESA